MLDLRPSFFLHSVLAPMNCGYEMHKASFCIRYLNRQRLPVCNFGYKIHTMICFRGTKYIKPPHRIHWKYRFLGTNYLMFPLCWGYKIHKARFHVRWILFYHCRYLFYHCRYMAIELSSFLWADQPTIVLPHPLLTSLVKGPCLLPFVMHQTPPYTIKGQWVLIWKASWGSCLSMNPRCR